jgi:twitching motility protein PilT
MAAIDSILRILVLRDAEAMTITSGQVPSLRRAGNVEKMSMPALDAAMVAGFVDELAPSDGARADLAARGSLEVTHAVGDTAFTVTIEKVSAGYKLAARRGARPAAPRALTAVPAPVSDTSASQRKPSPAAVSDTSASPRNVSSATASAAVSDTGASARNDASTAVHGTALPPAAVHGTALPPAAVHGTALLGEVRALPPRLAALVAHALAVRASDVLLSTGTAPRLRVDGELVAAPDDLDHPVDDADVAALLGERERDEVARRGSADFAADGPEGRLRVNVFRHHGGLGAALRLVRTDVPSPRDLRLPDDVTDAVAHRSGLVLVCGPAGAGKSTTLVALVEHINRTRARHVITLEDPIEYRYQPRRCLIHQREIGVHAPSFADGLRAALRESPDVLVVGELRDRDTIAIALTAAETGHLVLGTLHAPGAAVAIDRIVDVFPEHQQRQVRLQLASVLRVVLTQVLVPGRGGRAPALERVVVTPAVAHLVRKSELQMLGSLIQAGRDHGMIPLERSLAALVRAGIADAATARAAAIEVDLFDQLVRARD